MIPRKALRSRLRPIAPAILLALLAVPGMRASSEPFIAQNPGPGSVTIEGKWQFHLGDDLGWSNPSLDDSNWEQLDGDHEWGDQTHPGYTGFAWYRKHIQIGGRAGKLAVLIPPVDTHTRFTGTDTSWAQAANSRRTRGGSGSSMAPYTGWEGRRWMACWRCGCGRHPWHRMMESGVAACEPRL